MNCTKEEIVTLLDSEGASREALFARAAALKRATVGDGVYLRGLIEYSNVCRKNCLYCGIRRDAKCERYTLTESQVEAAARLAYEKNYGSVVLQGGENQSAGHIETITRLIGKIKALSDGRLGITLSLGEHSRETYRRWFDAGAHRYLLRIEASNPDLYRMIHPRDGMHDYASRIGAIRDLRSEGYQVGTGVMIGLPFQSTEDLAGDLLFMKEMDIDMCGMGPYVVSHGTPLAVHSEKLRPEMWRFDMTLKMIAVLRLMMPDINIAATTALQAIDPDGRMKAIAAGANVVMPNLTPDQLRGNYNLYDNKPLSFDSRLTEENIRYGEWGDSLRFRSRKVE